jgi:type IV pilus assembly protein PilP
MGLNHGRVWRVRREGIDLLEIVPSGDDGWIERPQSLTMRQRDAYAR